VQKKVGRPPGRPPKDANNKKIARLSVRISAKLRDELEEARKLPDGEVSLAEQVQRMLWSALTSEKEIEKRFGGPATARLLEILAEHIRLIEISTGGPDAELRWYNDRFTYDQVRSMIEVVLDHFKPDGRRAIPKALRAHPSLKNEVVENLGKHNAMLAVAYLKSAGALFSKESEVPTLYRKAALPLGRRLQGSPMVELRKQQRQTRQVLLENLERIMRKVKGPTFSLPPDFDLERFVDAAKKAEQEIKRVQKGERK
jgi:hypothetical protein